MPLEDLRELIRTTKFKQMELRRWYSKFCRDYPSGKMDKQDFYKLLGKVSKTALDSAADHLFRLFDHDHDGNVGFKELMSTLSLTTSGSVKKKMKWIFDVYDVDGNGTITLEELQNVVTCMQSIKTRRRYSATRFLTHEMLKFRFNKTDRNNKGELTLEEFTELTESLPELITVLNP